MLAENFERDDYDENWTYIGYIWWQWI